MLAYSKKTKNDYSITDYLIWGGFPKILEFSNKEDREVYLNDIYSSIVNKDLIVRFNIKNTELFKKITNYILKSNARVFSSRSIENYNVFNNDSNEIDFIASKDNEKYYIQVAYSVAEDKAYEREFRAFNNIDNNSKKILITNDEINYSTSVIEHIKLKDFLLMESLDN